MHIFEGEKIEFYHWSTAPDVSEVVPNSFDPNLFVTNEKCVPIVAEEDQERGAHSLCGTPRWERWRESEINGQIYRHQHGGSSR